MKPQTPEDELAAQMAYEIFQKFDTDNNGSIDKEEAKSIFFEKLK